MTNLFQAVPSPREYDLPPRWDGRIVSWDGWTDRPPPFICGRGVERDVCLRCGSVAPPVVNTGTYYPLKGDTREALVEVATKRTGRRYLKNRTVPETPHRRLLAFRCPDCRHDHVLDVVTDTWWDLGDEDYGPDGSR